MDSGSKHQSPQRRLHKSRPLGKPAQPWSLRAEARRHLPRLSGSDAHNGEHLRLENGSFGEHDPGFLQSHIGGVAGPSALRRQASGVSSQKSDYSITSDESDESGAEVEPGEAAGAAPESTAAALRRHSLGMRAGRDDGDGAGKNGFVAAALRTPVDSPPKDASKGAPQQQPAPSSAAEGASGAGVLEDQLHRLSLDGSRLALDSGGATPRLSPRSADSPLTERTADLSLTRRNGAALGPAARPHTPSYSNGSFTSRASSSRRARNHAKAPVLMSSSLSLPRAAFIGSRRASAAATTPLASYINAENPLQHKPSTASLRSEAASQRGQRDASQSSQAHHVDSLARRSRRTGARRGDRQGGDRQGGDRQGADRQGGDRQGTDRQGGDKNGAPGGGLRKASASSVVSIPESRRTALFVPDYSSTSLETTPISGPYASFVNGMGHTTGHPKSAAHSSSSSSVHGGSAAGTGAAGTGTAPPHTPSADAQVPSWLNDALINHSASNVHSQPLERPSFVRSAAALPTGDIAPASREQIYTVVRDLGLKPDNAIRVLRDDESDAPVRPAFISRDSHGSSTFSSDDVGDSASMVSSSVSLPSQGRRPALKNQWDGLKLDMRLASYKVKKRLER